jgi:hypothetical protein
MQAKTRVSSASTIPSDRSHHICIPLPSTCLAPKPSPVLPTTSPPPRKSRYRPAYPITDSRWAMSVPHTYPHVRICRYPSFSVRLGNDVGPMAAAGNIRERRGLAAGDAGRFRFKCTPRLRLCCELLSTQGSQQEVPCSDIDRWGFDRSTGDLLRCVPGLKKYVFVAVKSLLVRCNSVETSRTPPGCCS